MFNFRVCAFINRAVRIFKSPKQGEFVFRAHYSFHSSFSDSKKCLAPEIPTSSGVVIHFFSQSKTIMPVDALSGYVMCRFRTVKKDRRKPGLEKRLLSDLDRKRRLRNVLIDVSLAPAGVRPFSC